MVGRMDGWMSRFTATLGAGGGRPVTGRRRHLQVEGRVLVYWALGYTMVYRYRRYLLAV